MARRYLYLYLILLIVLSTAFASLKRKTEEVEEGGGPGKKRKLAEGVGDESLKRELELAEMPVCQPGQHDGYEIPSDTACKDGLDKAFNYYRLVFDRSEFNRLVNSAAEAIMSDVCRPSQALFDLLFVTRRDEVTKKCINTHAMQVTENVLFNTFSTQYYIEYVIKRIQYYYYFNW